MRRYPLNFKILDKYDLLGITGNAASGKDYIAKQISQRGYIHVSSSDILREEMANMGKVINRETQTQTANELRKMYGIEILVLASLKRALEISEHTTHTGIIISGLYAPGEGDVIRSLGGRIINVMVSSKDSSRIRFERLGRRQEGPRDAIDYTAFEAAFVRENSGTQPHQANVSSIARLADFCIINDDDTEKLKEQIDNILKG